MKRWLVWLIIAQGADLTTTALNSHGGCKEHSFWPNARTAAVGKVSATVSLTITLPILEREHHPVSARLLAATGAIAGMEGATYNLVHYKECHP